MGNSEGQTLVLEQLVGLSMFTPHELWACHETVIKITERIESKDFSVNRRIAELKTATHQDEFCPVFCNILEDLGVPVVETTLTKFHT